MHRDATRGGEGSIFKDPANGRWRALVDVGADASGKRQRNKVSGRTRAEVLLKMREVQRDADDGLDSGGRHVTVAALAASVYLVYLLEILKVRRLFRRESDEEFEERLETGEFEAIKLGDSQ